MAQTKTISVGAKPTIITPHTPATVALSPRRFRLARLERDEETDIG